MQNCGHLPEGNHKNSFTFSSPIETVSTPGRQGTAVFEIESVRSTEVVHIVGNYIVGKIDVGNENQLTSQLWTSQLHMRLSNIK